ncbi:class I SAM-dependent methyltransferase [Micromonospora zamorensis]|uniref:class I SAM-dependent methyltransferase n=1 Tax=Micromonospora zamorensis TaxID=709883 RepID=UPI0036CBD93A
MSDLFDYDAELRLHNELFRAAARVGSHDRVLDIGCGTGQSTRDAARAAVNGSATGIDISGPMLERLDRHRSSLTGIAGSPSVAGCVRTTAGRSPPRRGSVTAR